MLPNTFDTSKIIFISQALHHLEKSIFLREKFFLEARIFNFHKNQRKLQSHKKNYSQKFISHYSGFEQLDFLRLEDIDIFILYSFSPTLPLINFLNKVKKLNKKLLLIQDNHQFSVHQGSVNSIILRPDLVIAASECDKRYLINNLYFSEEEVISQGWLFGNALNAAGQSTPKKGNKTILIAFSAPPEITLLSDETYQVRKKIIYWAQENFRDHQLLIKLHPHESLNNFRTYLAKHDISHTLLSSQSTINDAIELCDVVLCSNESQIALDVISQATNKDLFLYFLKKNNFLKDKTNLAPNKLFEIRENLQFGSLAIDARKEIKEEYLGTNPDSLKKIVDRLLKLSKESDSHSDTFLDIYLWLFIYHQEKFLIEFLRKDLSRKYKNLLGLVQGKDFVLSELISDFAHSRSRDPICLILIRYYLKNHLTFDQSKLNLLSKNFFSEYIFQFFFRDLIRLNNLALSKLVPPFFEEKYLNLIIKIEDFYFSKTKVSQIFFVGLKKMYLLKINPISRITFYISDKILKI